MDHCHYPRHSASSIPSSMPNALTLPHFGTDQRIVSHRPLRKLQLEPADRHRDVRRTDSEHRFDRERSERPEQADNFRAEFLFSHEQSPSRCFAIHSSAPTTPRTEIHSRQCAQKRSCIVIVKTTPSQMSPSTLQTRLRSAPCALITMPLSRSALRYRGAYGAPTG